MTVFTSSVENTKTNNITVDPNAIEIGVPVNNKVRSINKMKTAAIILFGMFLEISG